MPRIVAGGSRRDAFRGFCGALADPEKTFQPVLLVDSEGPVTTSSPWQHLALRPEDRWEQPSGSSDDQCHLMVQAMEAWLIADGVALASIFGNGFRSNALPDRADIELIPKAEALRALEHATRECANPYRKGGRSFEAMAELDPALVQNASPWARRFFATITRLCS